MIFLIPIFRHGLLIMTGLAETLPVPFIPEQFFIPTMRYDMIHHRSFYQHFLHSALLTQRMCFQESASGFLPMPVISTPIRGSTIIPMYFSVLFTIKSCSQLRTSRMLAGLLWFHRHSIFLPPMYGQVERIKSLPYTKAKEKAPWIFSTELVTVLRILRITQVAINFQ